MGLTRWGLPTALLVLHAGAVATAIPLRLCTSDTPFYPYTMLDGSGLLQQRLQELARDAGINVVASVAPRARCLQATRQGEADALIGVFVPERLAWMGYPMRDGRADSQRGLGSARFSLYRRAATETGWDGKRITGAGALALGVQYGYAYGRDVRALGVPVDDRATSPEQLFGKLERGRIALALMQEAQANQLLQRLPPGRIEAIHPPFGLDFYVILTQDFQRRHPQAAARLWTSRPDWRGAD